MSTHRGKARAAKPQDRDTRLAQALRENLHRRKAQARARAAEQPQSADIEETEREQIAGTRQSES